MAKRYPSIRQIEKSQDREVVFEVKRSLRSILSHVVLFLSLISIIALLSIFFPDARLSDSIPVIKHISFRWLAIFPSLVLLEMIRKYHDDLYIFGHHRLTHLDGRLSLSYSIPVIKFIDIRSISVHQDLVGRVFNYGDVELSTAAQEGSELMMSGIVAPLELAELIDQLRNRSRKMVAGGVKDSDKDFIRSVFTQMSAALPSEIIAASETTVNADALESPSLSNKVEVQQITVSEEEQSPTVEAPNTQSNQPRPPSNGA